MQLFYLERNLNLKKILIMLSVWSFLYFTLKFKSLLCLSLKLPDLVFLRTLFSIDNILALLGAVLTTLSIGFSEVVEES